MIEKITEDRFNLDYYFKVTEHVLCMNSSRSYDVEGEEIWIQRISKHTQDKKKRLYVISFYLISYENCVNLN